MEQRNDSDFEKFIMYRFKVVLCPRRAPHAWDVCPFAHVGESARRRPPHLYSAQACRMMNKEGGCPFGNDCPNTHNAFEYNLHPAKFRTKMCSLGATCDRKICFFAHNLSEYRGCLPVARTSSMNSTDTMDTMDSSINISDCSSQYGEIHARNLQNNVDYIITLINHMDATELLEFLKSPYMRTVFTCWQALLLHTTHEV